MHLLIVLVAAAAVPWAVAVREVLGVDPDSEWEQFKKDYGKTYAPDEEPARRAIWGETVKRVLQHNLGYQQGKRTYTMAVNHFADMTTEEYKGGLLGLRQDAEELLWMRAAAKRHVKSSVKLPEEVDWRKKGYVTPVKNQCIQENTALHEEECCGSCYAFSTTGSLEGQHFKKTGNLVSLSEQNLVDCSSFNKACKGGSVALAFLDIMNEGGVDTEESYPYEARNGTCRFEKDDVGAKLKGFIRVEEGSEDDLLDAVATVGPVSAGIDANHTSFVYYGGGIYDNPGCRTKVLDHAVLVVGYGSENGVDYWLVKNSWGENWGEQGYVRMARNRNNQCGIATLSLYPVV